MAETSLATIPELKGIEQAIAQPIIDAFMPHYTGIIQAVEASKGLNVTDPTDVDGIAAARKARLKIRAARIELNKVREEKKEVYLRMGKAIQSVYNRGAALAEPEEKRLQDMEDIAARMQAERKAKLQAARAEMVRPYIDIANPAEWNMNFGDMPQPAFDSLMAGMKAAHEKRLADRQAEEEAKALAEFERREREEEIRRENERLKQEAAEKARKQAEIDAENARKAEEERKVRDAEAKRIEAERAAEREKARKEAEALRKKQEEERKKREAIEAEARRQREAAEAEKRRIEREAAEALRKEREERERLIREAKAKEEAEKRRQAEEKAKQEAEARKAAAAPDREKLLAFAYQVEALKLPEMASEDGKLAMDEVRQTLRGFVSNIRHVARTL